MAAAPDGGGRAAGERDVAPLCDADPEYRRLFELGPHPTWVYDRETLRFLAVNDAAVTRYGWSREAFLTTLTLRDIRPPQDVPKLERTVAGPGSGRRRSGQWRHRLSDGTVVDVDVTSQDVEFRGRPARLVVVVDVTETRHAKDRLRWLERAIEQTESPIFLTRPDGTITYVNPAFEAFYGYTAQQALGATPRILKSGEMSPEHYESLWHTLKAGRNYRGTHVNRTRDGALVTVDATVTALRGADDEVVGYVAIHQDLTEQRRLEQNRERLEEQLAHAQRFEALGTLAAGMAHDFNNLLGVVLGHAALLAQRPTDAARVTRAAEALRLAGERGASLAQRILVFARRSESRFEAVDAWAIAVEVERLLRDILPPGISTEVAADPGQAYVWGDRGQLQQVLLNVCINARDAMPSGGRLSLRVARVPGSRVRACFPEAAASEYVETSVTDTGTGMSEETRRRVFEPFFTTKPPGKGSGLGLPVVYGIVKAHGGIVDVETAENRGTVFRVYLPLCLAPAAPLREAAASRRGGTVLLVEDEELLAEVVRAWLEDAGYEVLTARDGEQAVALFRERPASIDVVVCDMGLPKGGGRQIFFALREIAPAVRVVLVSGFLEPSERVELARAGVAGFLEKPCRQDQLLGVLEQVQAPAAQGGG